MRVARISRSVTLLLVCGCGTAPSTTPMQATSASKVTPLILEKNEGERRVFRGWPGHPNPGSAFILKVDPKNGGSSHLVFGTEEMAPGDSIPTHRHPSSDEILFLATGTMRVHLGDSVRVVHGGSTVFIPANTWVSVANIGTDVISLAFAFSSPGFEEFMRAESVREGETIVPVPQSEDDSVQRLHSHDVIYK